MIDFRDEEQLRGLVEELRSKGFKKYEKVKTVMGGASEKTKKRIDKLFEDMHPIFWRGRTPDGGLIRERDVKIERAGLLGRLVRIACVYREEYREKRRGRYREVTVVFDIGR